MLQVDGDLFITSKFVDALKIPYIAPSFGGCESIVDQPAIMSYWYVINFPRVCILVFPSVVGLPTMSLVDLFKKQK
jgi:hypothetical protein